MTLSALNGTLSGLADDALDEIVGRFEGYLSRDPDMSIQIAAYAHGRPVLDAWGGPHMSEDSLIVPFSVSKNSIGIVAGLLIQRGQLDLDATVASYWPEFAQAGKRNVTVRQLLSHQAGLPDADPHLSGEDLLHDHRAADRLATTWPFWRPGTAFGYHGATIGNLAGELVFRITGETIQRYYEREVRAPLGAEFYLGLPPELDGRRVETLPIIQPLAEHPQPDVHPLRSRVFGGRGSLDFANDERSWRFGHPAVSASVSARGVARMLAGAVTGVDGAPPLLDAETVSIIGEQQVRGRDEVLDLEGRGHSIVFQKPSAAFAWGGPRSFGHDGAAGSVGCVDPETGIAFGYTISRGPWPGGGDPRAIAAARRIGELGL